MKKLELVLAGVLVLSPALFAQQDTSRSATQKGSTSTAQSAQESSGKAKLTADQKAELKQLRAKAKDACKADKNSDACKTARRDLRAKKDEYGVKSHHHARKGMKKSGESTQSPS